MKPSVTQIAHAFKVDPAHVLDTRVRGNHPPLLFARAVYAEKFAKLAGGAA